MHINFKNEKRYHNTIRTKNARVPNASTAKYLSITLDKNILVRVPLYAYTIFQQIFVFQYIVKNTKQNFRIIFLKSIFFKIRSLQFFGLGHFLVKCFWTLFLANIFWIGRILRFSRKLLELHQNMEVAFQFNQICISDGL